MKNNLNILSPFVDYFIITESIYDHQGNIRELVFDKKKFSHILPIQNLFDINNPKILIWILW